jgi:asparagine synthase (glutamine-hydrolysing)
MMDAQVHRGPDGSGVYRGERAILGHRRLAIIDLSEAGRQPMCNEDGTVWVTYNGEVYNFGELRDELRKRGHEFKSKTDTEVLVHGYEEWDIEGLLPRLRGMFAFGLYDIRPINPGGRLLLAKDRFGIKPLYYSYQKDDRILFASEVRALLKTGMVSDERNPVALIRFLQLGSIPVPLTAQRAISAIPAGHYAVIDQHGFRLKKYWNLADVMALPMQVEKGFDLNQAASATRGLLEEAVVQHLLSDVPLGIFLSGGLDSSALVAVASQFRGRPLTTLSIVFDEQDYSEAPFSQMVAKQYGTDHREVLVRSKDFLESLPRMFSSMDQPTIDGVNTFLVSKAAKEAGLTVVLSGAGADEVFLGYSYFKTAYAWKTLWPVFAGLPAGVRNGLIALAIRAGSLAGKTGMEKLAYLEKPSEANAYLLFRGLFTPRQICDLLGIEERELESTAPTPKAVSSNEEASLVEGLAKYEFEYYLQNQLLKDTDVMSMAWSVETRVPFLDHRLVEYVTRLPLRLKIQRQINKPVLVSAMHEDFPREVWDRRKMGFTFPFARWLKEHSAELEDLCGEHRYLDPKAVSDIWNEFRKDRMHWSRPWSTIVTGQWGLSLSGTGTSMSSV